LKIAEKSFFYYAKEQYLYAEKSY